MGITEVLTIIFVVLKLLGRIDWSWWQVLLPEILAAVGYILIWIAAARTAHLTFRKIDREFDKLDERW